MKVLMIDNYDSFTYNLVHIIESVWEGTVSVFRNNRITLEEIGNYDKIILSPGPGLPSEAGIMPELIKKYASSKSILGVCLGMQGIAEVFGAKLNNLGTVHHGVALPVLVENEDLLFNSCPKKFQGGRYHSWVVSKDNFPDTLEITATDEEDNIMALRHKNFDVSGVQFHPESILTEYGKQIIKNWIAS